MSAAQFEEVMLNRGEEGCQPLRWRFGEDYPYEAVQFIDRSIGLHAQVVLVHQLAVSQAGLALVPGLGHYRGQSLAHICPVLVWVEQLVVGVSEPAHLEGGQVFAVRRGHGLSRDVAVAPHDIGLAMVTEVRAG